MITFSKESIKKILTMKEAIQASKEALTLYSEKKSVVPLRVSIDIPTQQGTSLFMPAYIEELNIIGIKIVSIFPNNRALGLPAVPAQMLLLDGKTGEVCAILDGTYLTQLRTGAVQGAATDILARKNAKIAALIGTGGQASTQLEALLTIRELEEIRVCGRNFKHTQQFAETMKNTFTQFNTRIIAVENSNDAIKEADIITAVTTSKQPVFDGKLVKQGAHINGMGAYMPDMQELPDSIIQCADKIIFDTREGVLAEAGDILIPLKMDMMRKENLTGELGEVMLGKIKGRETEQEITLFKSVGTAILDLVTAFKIYQRASE